MKVWKHLTLEKIKFISSGIAYNYLLKNIGEALELDPTSISKEVKRNRFNINLGIKNVNCKRVNRWPYVCLGCNKRYTNCSFTKYKYDALLAQRKADNNLINSRKGIDISSDDFLKLDETIKDGIDNKKSIYQIKVENNNIINKSISTLYRYVNNGYL